MVWHPTANYPPAPSPPNRANCALYLHSGYVIFPMVKTSGELDYIQCEFCSKQWYFHIYADYLQLERDLSEHIWNCDMTLFRAEMIIKEW